MHITTLVDGYNIQSFKLIFDIECKGCGHYRDGQSMMIYAEHQPIKVGFGCVNCRKNFGRFHISSEFAILEHDVETCLISIGDIFTFSR